jgi:hypothetical protein
MSIPFFLVTRPHQQGRLLDQASLSSPLHQKAPQDLNPQDCTGSPVCVRQTHPKLPTASTTKQRTLTICTSSSGSIKSTITLQEVLKGCVRYPLAIYLQRNKEFTCRIITSMYFWHKAQYCEIGGKRKYTATSLRYMCVMLRLGAQVSRKPNILCTNLTVKLI